MPQADQYSRLPGPNFNRHAKFTQTEQLNNTELDKKLPTFRLKKREDFWIHKVKTLKPHGFNAELNFPNPQNFCSFGTIFLSSTISYAEGTVIIPQRHCKRKMTSNL